MNKIAEDTLRYFRPKKNYFWHWAENGNVIEWQDGSTICYKDELIIILRKINKFRQIPPLGALLLTLSACQNNWKESNKGLGILNGILQSLASGKPDTDKEVLEYHIHQAVKFMDIANQLSEDLRTGPKKAHLIFEIFRDSSHLVSEEAGHALIEEFESGRLDSMLFQEGEDLSTEIFQYDLKYLVLALKQFPSANSLELRAVTGLDKLPEPSVIELPEPEPIDILAQLEQDPKTEGIARLTRHLIAALTIPMHSHGSSDQPLGGVSDITNRGSLDRLLLSELAQDDLVLTARLVNNEALYLRREEPPDHLNKERIILLDTTIKMWGVPRVFGLSAALSFARTAKHIGVINTYALGGAAFETIDLTTKKGITDTLQSLDPSLNFRKSLQSFINFNQSITDKEYVLISDQNAIENSEIRKILNELKEVMIFLISVNRNGELSYFEFFNGKSRLISSLKLDLGELLFNSGKKVKNTVKMQEGLPAFFEADPCPLNYPTTSIKPSIQNIFHQKGIGIIGITETQRLLYWPDKDSGAKELVHFIEEGDYAFGSDGTSNVYLMISNPAKKFLKLYKIIAKHNVVAEHEISNGTDAAKQVLFHESQFYIITQKLTNLENKEPIPEVVIVDCIKGRIVDKTNYMNVANVLKNNSTIISYNLLFIKRYINYGYSVLQKAKNIFINKNGDLSIDKHHLKLNAHDGSIKWIENRKAGVKQVDPEEEPERGNMTDNIHIRFYKKVWKDGSEAVVDSRGLLHLRSSDSRIPEMTFILVIGKTSACWTSDGAVVGSHYFTNRDEGSNKQSILNIQDSLKKFIDRLL